MYLYVSVHSRVCARTWGSPELERQEGEMLKRMLGIRLKSSGRSESALNSWAISPNPGTSFFTELSFPF